MTVFTAVFLACTLVDTGIQCSIEQGRSYPTKEACLKDTYTRASKLNETVGNHRVALIPGRTCMKTIEQGA
jgi:hypothetical protein